MTVSPDAQAVLLTCSHLGLQGGTAAKPLTLGEWNDLAARVHASPLERPAAFLDLSADRLCDILGLPADLADRLRRLLDRGAALASELERLETLGIWALTRADADYPARYRQRLKANAPVVLFGAGRRDLLGETGLAVVGSRNADSTVLEAAEFAGRTCADGDWVLYSGGAKGVDGRAMTAALDAGGRVVGVLADNLERAVRAPAHREAIAEGRLTLVTPYSPKAPFTVGGAMGRNKLVYALSDWALVVASDLEAGGTWAGATEALKAGWVPVAVCDGPAFPDGNRALLRRGGVSFPYPPTARPVVLTDWLADAPPHRFTQPTLF
jgi:predicted Rossmann fold nucleotide-binding protein DprA/Smf involved in DNA uptake